MKLPPGQRSVPDFPRFGLGGRPPTVPAEPTIEIGGILDSPVTLQLSELVAMPRRALTADFHCVSGWTATDLHWEGVAFADFYEAVLRPRLGPEAPVTHVVLEGLDGYRSVAWLEDLLDPDVLLADRLAGRPLTLDHGAPVRLVSPAQYGFVSTKHLARIELHTSEPRVRYHPSRRSNLGLNLVKPHPRARVRHEERHRYVPALLLRPVYRRLIPQVRMRNAATPGADHTIRS